MPAHKKSKNPSSRRRKPKQTSKMNILSGVGKYSKGRSRRLRGRGGYGQDIGAKLGGFLGDKAQGFLSDIFGLGSYKVNHNSLWKDTTLPNDPPIVSNTSGATRVQHREYIQDIVGSTTFIVEAFPINPGLSLTFPWLSAVANCFEEYRMHGILFEFKSTSADALNSTNTALGTVIMATEYNPLHPNFSAKRDMENYVYSTTCAPSICAIHPVECARDVSVLDELFVRNVPQTGADLRFSDIGNFQIATVGMQASAVIGELWVTYDIELIKPKLPDAISSIASAHYAFSTTTGPNATGVAPIATNYFGTLAVQKLGLLGTGVSPVALSTSTIFLNQPGTYLVAFALRGASTAVSIPTLTPSANVSLVTILHNGGLNGYEMFPTTGSTTAKILLLFCVTLPSGAGDVTITGGTIPATITDADLFVFPLPQGYSQIKRSELDRLTEFVELLSLKVAQQEKILSLEYQDIDMPNSSPTLTRIDDHDHLSKSTIDFAKLLKSRLLDQSLP
jgi:hypothetical protein